MFKGIKGKKQKEVISKEEVIKQKKELTAQQFIPIADIKNYIAYRKDGYILGMLRVQPKEISLFSKNEIKTLVRGLTQVFNGKDYSIQFLCIGRPADLNNYFDWLQEKAKMEGNITRKMLLKGKMEYASQMVSEGKVSERRFYIIISKENNEYAEKELIERMREFNKELIEASLISHICNDDEILELNSLFANPIQSAFEKYEVSFELPPVLNI